MCEPSIFTRIIFRSMKKKKETIHTDTYKTKIIQSFIAHLTHIQFYFPPDHKLSAYSLNVLWNNRRIIQTFSVIKCELKFKSSWDNVYYIYQSLLNMQQYHLSRHNVIIVCRSDTIKSKFCLLIVFYCSINVFVYASLNEDVSRATLFG